MAVLLFVTTGLVLVHGYLVRIDRLAFIDQQVRNTATALLDSELGELRRVNFNTVESILAKELGDSRVGKFFIIRNQKGKILFDSSSVKDLAIENVPRDTQWVTISRHGRYIRILNLQLPTIHDRMLQVGLVLDEEILSPPFLSRSSLLFLIVAMTLGFAVAWFLSGLLLKPINDLARFVGGAADLAKSSNEIPDLPAGLFPKRRRKEVMRNDEFSTLLKGLQAFISRINKNYKVSRFWTYQMAHEIKTPLSILNVELEEAELNGRVSEDLAVSMRKELSRASDVVSSFLSWAELENSRTNRHLHMNRASRSLHEIADRLETRFPARLRVEIEKDFNVLANPLHLEQALINLVSNALKYSTEDKEVVVTVRTHRIDIKDSGPGVPEEVLDRIGEPFNRASKPGTVQGKPNGHGLGLAWVSSVAKLYGWELLIDSSAEGTTASLIFGESSEQFI